MIISFRRVLLLLLGFSLVWSIIHHQVAEGKFRVITWDSYGYYLYLPAILKFGDISDFAFVQQHLDLYKPSDTAYQIFEKDGQKTPTYTMGVAILWLPFYAIADIWASVDPRFPADGLSQPYQWMVILAGLTWLALGLFWLHAFLGRYLQPRTVLITLSILVLGTNLFYYTTVQPGMPHVYLFALYAGLLLLLERLYASPTWGKGVLLGFCLAVMALCRPSEALAVILVAGFLWQKAGNLTALGKWIRLHWPVLGVAVLAGLVTIFPQMLIWKWTTGQWIYNTYAAYGHTFDLTRPHLLDGLFSYRKGWLVYTPLMILGVAGLIPLVRKRNTWAWPVVLFFIVNLWIVLSWHIWWYAGSFGMRALVQSCAVLALPLGMGWEAWSGTSWRRSFLPALVFLACGLNLFQSWQIENGILKSDQMNRPYYWAAFGKVKPDRSMLRWLNIPEAPANPPLYAEQIVQLRASRDSTRQAEWVQDRMAWLVRGTDQYSPTIRITLTDTLAREWSGQWLQLSAWIHVGDDTAPGERGAHLAFHLQQPEGDGAWYGMQLVRMAEPGGWWPVQYEVKMPENLRAGDAIVAVVWVPDSPDRFWVSEITLSRLFF